MLSQTRTKFNHDLAPILAHFLDEFCKLQQWRNKFKDSMTTQSYSPSFYFKTIHTNNSSMFNNTNKKEQSQNIKTV